MPYTKRRKGKQAGPPGRTSPVSTDTAAEAASGGEEASTKHPDDLILTSEKRRGIYECDYCHSDISQLPRIRCAVCSDFDLCLECFTTTDHAAASARLRAALETQQALQNEGTTVTNATSTTPVALHHDDTHGYRVCDSTRYPAFPTSRHVVNWKGSGSNSAAAEEKSTSSDPTTEGEEGEAGDVTQAMEIDSEEKKKPVLLGKGEINETTAGAEKSLEELVVAVVTDDPKLVWTVEEDLRLLEGIRSHGLGNWVEIAEVVSGQGSNGKTPRRCMERYMDDFLGRYGHILPPYTLIMEDDTNESSSGLEDSATNSSVEDEKMTEPGKTDGTPATPVSFPVDGTPRSSKRRAVLMRSPSAVSGGGWTQRKRFRVVHTESIEGYDQIWPDPYIPPGLNIQVGDEVGRDLAYKAEQTYVRISAAASTPEESERIRKEWSETKLNKPGGPTVLPPRLDEIVQMPGSDLVGFMPRRGDFDIEHENDAEQAIADMEFLPNEPEEDRKLKLQVLAIYNSKLDEREKRKDFIISRQLWDYRALYQGETKLPRDERDLVHRMRLFERFHTPAEHQKFLADILKAKRLRKEIAKLQMYRRIGIRTLADAERYELDKQRRVQHRLMVQQHRESEAKKEDQNPTVDNRTGGLAEETTSTSLWKQYRTGERRNRKSINRGDPGESPKNTAFSPGTTAGNEARNASISESGEGEKGIKKNGFEQNQDGGDNLGCDLSNLSPSERELCEKLSLTEAQYNEFKKVLISESLAQGLLDKETIGSSKRALVKMDVERKGPLIEFMLRAGWVSAKAAATWRPTGTAAK